jgi:hypothetical protein
VGYGIRGRDGDCGRTVCGGFHRAIYETAGDPLRLCARAAWRRQAGRQQLGDGVDEPARCSDRCRCLGGRDRRHGRANAVVCRRLKLVSGRKKAGKLTVNAGFTAREPSKLAGVRRDAWSSLCRYARRCMPRRRHTLRSRLRGPRHAATATRNLLVIAKRCADPPDSRPSRPS